MYEGKRYPRKMIQPSDREKSTKRQSRSISFFNSAKNQTVFSVISLPAEIKSDTGFMPEPSDCELDSSTVYRRTTVDITQFSRKRGTAYNFPNTIPNSISVIIIWASPKMKAPVILSGKERRSFCLKKKRYQEKNSRRLIVMYAVIFKVPGMFRQSRQFQGLLKLQSIIA